MCTSSSALAKLNSPPCVRTLPTCLPTISAPAAQDSPGGGRGQEDRKCHPHFTDLGSLREHTAACFIAQVEKSQPKGGKSLVLGPGNRLRETRRRAQSPRQGGGHPGALVISQLETGQDSCAQRVAYLAGRRDEGWWIGALTKASSQPLDFHWLLGRQQFLPLLPAFPCSLFWP